MENDDQNIAFHVRLKRLRSERELTAKAVANRVGVAESTYREWEYGRPLTGPPFVKLAQTLSVPLSFLMTGEHMPSHKIIDELKRIEGELANLRSSLASLI